MSFFIGLSDGDVYGLFVQHRSVKGDHFKIHIRRFGAKAGNYKGRSVHRPHKVADMISELVMLPLRPAVTDDCIT